MPSPTPNPSRLSRRQFLSGGAAVVMAGSFVPWLRAENRLTATLTVKPSICGAAVPSRFTGLSYEAAQLMNPDFFSPANQPLIALFRALGRRGVLRIGGGTSDYTVWTPAATVAAVPYDAFGPATSKGEKIIRLVTPQTIHNLRGFLDAVDWDLLYGLNMARGTATAAADEAAAVQQIMGPRFLAFQCGNEPDAWRTRYRPATWTFDDFFAEWLAFTGEIRGRVPNIRFAGPDISNKVPWLTQFAEKARGKIVMLTSHYYAEGPASSPDATLDRLLAPNPKLTADLCQILPAVRASGVPWRMCEGNSCWDGGKPGVSDTFASALWCADMMLQFARAGCCGVNLHGGGNGYYTPIAGDDRHGFVRRPEYFGMQFAQAIAGAKFIDTTLECDSDRVTAYAAVLNNQHLLAVFNKSENLLAVTVRGLVHGTLQQRPEVLAAPSIDSKDGITLGKSSAVSVDNYRGSALLMRLPPYRAALLHL
jgi:hypothetical protein